MGARRFKGPRFGLPGALLGPSRVREACVGTTPTPRCTPPGIFLGILFSFAGWDGVRYAWDLGPGEEPSPKE